MKVLLFLILSFSSLCAFAQDGPTEAEIEVEKKYIIIDGPKIKDGKISLENQLRKTIMSIFLKDKQYTILLNKEIDLKRSKLQAFRINISGVRVQDKKKKSSYELTMSLVDERQGKEVRDLIESEIAERHLFYRTRLMVYELLYGEAYLEMLDKDARAKEKKRRDKKKKKVNKKPITKRPPPIDKTPAEIKAEAEAKALAKKIKKLKKKKELLAKQKKKRKKKGKVTISKFDSPDLDLRKDPAKPESTKGPFKAYYDFSYGLGYARETLNSKAKVQIATTTTSFEVENNLALLQLMVRANARLAPKQKMGLGLTARISKIMGETDYEVAAPMSVDAFIFKGFDAIPINFKLGFKYETNSFANLGFASSGIQPWSNKVVWLNYGVDLTLPLRNYWIAVGADIGSVFTGSTNHQTKSTFTPLEGSRIDMYVRSKITGSLSLEVKKSTISVSSLGSKNLENDQDQTTLTLIYN